jgi:hypothetical protein
VRNRRDDDQCYCTGTFNAYPLAPLANGARCGNNPNSTTLRVTILCAKR